MKMMLGVAVYVCSTVLSFTSVAGVLHECEEIGYHVTPNTIGKGGQAVVKSGTQSSDNMEVAIKIFLDEGAFDTESEIFNMISRGQKSTTRLPIMYAVCMHDESKAIVMEKLSISLTGKLKEERRFTDNFKIIREILEAVRELNRLNIVHRDIKPDNIMFTASGAVKLIDFGAAVQVANNDPTMIAGTPVSIAPERGSGVLYNSYDVVKEDSWATALTIFQLLAGIPLYYDNDEKKDYNDENKDYMGELIDWVSNDQNSDCPHRAVYYYYKCVIDEPTRYVNPDHSEQCPSIQGCSRPVCEYDRQKAKDIVTSKWSTLMRNLEEDSQSAPSQPALKRLLSSMLHFNNNERPRVSQALATLLEDIGLKEDDNEQNEENIVQNEPVRPTNMFRRLFQRATKGVRNVLHLG